MLATACDCGRPHRLTLDKARAGPGLTKTRRLEAQYAAELRKIARVVGMIVKGWAPDDGAFDLSKVPELKQALAKYSEVIRPWAKATAARIGAEVAIKERRSWAAHAQAMSLAMRREIQSAPTGETLRAFMDEQVRLITSLPTDAGERVHQLTLKGLETSGRASEVAREIMRTGEVTASRANLIARTETTRTASALTMARAQYVGSESYIWRTSRDADVRKSHRRMEGKVVPWGAPPTLDNLTGHAGMLPNCRCYPEPIIPEF